LRNEICIDDLYARSPLGRLYRYLLTLVSVVSDAEVQHHFDEFFEEIFVEMEEKVTIKTNVYLGQQDG